MTAGSPVLLLPLSSHSTEILVADLGRLSITNKFLHAASEGTISKVCAEPEMDNGIFSMENLYPPRPSHWEKEKRKKHHDLSLISAWPLLDVMQIDLANMDLYAGQRLHSSNDLKETSSLHLGSFVVAKRGPSLLREKCQLKLQLESNLDSMFSHAGKCVKQSFTYL